MGKRLVKAPTVVLPIEKGWPMKQGIDAVSLTVEMLSLQRP